MKAKPKKLVHGQGYIDCSVEEATHIELNIPGPSGQRHIPVILRGKREGTGCWTWNGSTEAPTLRPSVLTTGMSPSSEHNFRCHSWVNDGKAQFLNDCSHDMAGQTVELFEVI